MLGMQINTLILLFRKQIAKLSKTRVDAEFSFEFSFSNFGTLSLETVLNMIKKYYQVFSAEII